MAYAADGAANGRPRSWADILHRDGAPAPEALRRLEEVVANAYSLRHDLARRLLDPRRDIDDECGYPHWRSVIDPEFYQRLYDREPDAARVVSLWPRECWCVQPTVYEDEDSDTRTPFEEAWDAVGRQLRGPHCYHGQEYGSAVWEALARADELSGVGHFGLLFLGLDDGMPLREPAFDPLHPDSPSFAATAPGMGLSHPPPPGRPKEPQRKRGGYLGKQRRLLYVRAFPESLVQVLRWESNPANPRFGHPVAYSVTFSDPTGEQAGLGVMGSTHEVHWTRALHVADTFHQAPVSEVYAVPRMRPVLNRLLDLRKVLAADGETYWRNCVLKLFFETHPQLGGEVDVDTDSIKDQVENMLNGLQQWMATIGMNVKPVAPAVADPSPHRAAQVESICVHLGVPVRIFLGSERGELASSQDARAWARRVRGRRLTYCTPRILAPFVDRLIACSVLPAPQAEEGYRIDWPEEDLSDPAEEAAVLEARTKALTTYVQGGGEQVMPPMDFLAREMGYDEEEAESILEAAEEAAAERQEEALQEQEMEMRAREEEIARGLAPDPTEPPPGKGPPEPPAGNAEGPPGPFDPAGNCENPLRGHGGKFAGCAAGGGGGKGGGGRAGKGKGGGGPPAAAQARAIADRVKGGGGTAADAGPAQGLIDFPEGGGGNDAEGP